MSRPRPENPFIFGGIIEQHRFVNRRTELRDLIRDLSDGEKIFLLSPRRFGKSTLVSRAFLNLGSQHIRTVYVPVSSYPSYLEFLEGFAQGVFRAAGPWDRVKNWVGQFLKRVRPEATFNPVTGEATLSLGRPGERDAFPLASEVFAMPGELTRSAGFRMAICLDEFQQITTFDGESVENTLRNEVQKQPKVGYVFAGSQPALIENMLSKGRPFYKAGPVRFLDKIAAADWESHIHECFSRQGRSVTEAAFERMWTASDLIPFDVQRMAHELWDHAELTGISRIDADEVDLVIEELVNGQSTYYERLWQQLSARQRSTCRALAESGPKEIFSQSVRIKYRLGPASSVQKAIESLDAQDILDRYKAQYFFLDPLFAHWIKHLAR